MKKIFEDRRGITLVALVITIIVLLLLAGIAIVSLGGENGILVKARQAKNRYEISEAKEKLELAITDLKIEKQGKGEELKKEDLPTLNNKEIDVRDITNFPIEIICDNYKFNIDESFNVKYIEEKKGTIITYTTEPEGYTNKDEIKILIKIQNPNGIKTIQYPNDDDKIIANGKKEVGLDYKVIANGTYTFKIVDNNDIEVSKDIVINQIDRLNPMEIDISAKDRSMTSFKIEVNAIDAKADEKNACSGIDKYEYYIKKTNGSSYTKKNDNNSYVEFEQLSINTTYSVYVRVYDKAGNYLDSKVINVKTLEKPNAPNAKIEFDENENTKIKALEYPILNSDGIFNCELIPNIGENIKLEITSPAINDLKYYYSTDAGKTWNEYISTVNIKYEENTEIMVKSAYKENENVVSTNRSIKKYKKDLTYECTAKDSLRKEAYDGDLNTYTTLNGFQILLVDDTAIGYQIKAKWFENDNIRTVNAFSSEKYNYWDLLWYISPKENNAIQEGTATILEGTKSIISYTNGGSIKDLLYEISIEK